MLEMHLSYLEEDIFKQEVGKPVSLGNGFYLVFHRLYHPCNGIKNIVVDVID